MTTPKRIGTFRLTLYSFVFWALGLCSHISAANTELFNAQYEGEYSGWDIKMTRTLHKNSNGEYIFYSHAKNLFASITETSVFHIEEAQIKPASYKYYRKVFGKKKLETIQFDHAKKTATYSKNNKPYFTHNITENITDPALYQLLLQNSFRTSHANATAQQAIKNTDDYKKHSADFFIVKRNKIRHYAFQKNKTETITVNKKEYLSVLVEREQNNKHTKIWLIPEFDYAIGKLEHTDEDGDTYTLNLTHYHANSKELTQFTQQLTPLIKPPVTPDNSAARQHSEP